MRHTVLLLCAGTLLAAMAAIAPPLPAQDTARRTPEQIRASYDAHQGDFDGDWEFTSVSREFGAGRGYWSAVRLAEGAQVLDEYRVVGDSGQTWYVTNTLRAYNANLDQWELVSTERGSGCRTWAPRTARATRCTSSSSSAWARPTRHSGASATTISGPIASPGPAIAPPMAARRGRRNGCRSRLAASGRRGPWVRSHRRGSRRGDRAGRSTGGLRRVRVRAPG